jgi:hypothetical protein
MVQEGPIQSAPGSDSRIAFNEIRGRCQMAGIDRSLFDLAEKIWQIPQKQSIL